MAEAQGQLSDDGLWRWDDKKWVHVRVVDIGCERCGSIVAVDQGKKEFRCPEGHRQDLVTCKACIGTFQCPPEQRQYAVQCPLCSTRASTFLKSTPAWEWASERHQRGTWPPDLARTVDPDRRFLRAFTMAAGGGTRIPNGSSCLIDFSADGIKVTAGDVEESVPYADVHALQISGSTRRSGSRVIGGGFGAAGAVEGILAASVINSLTSKTTVFSLIRLAARSTEYVFVSQTLSDGSLNMMLTPVFLRIRQAQASAPLPSAPPGSISVADELAKLAQLRDAGVLSDAEFASAKTRLLA